MCEFTQIKGRKKEEKLKQLTEKETNGKTEIIKQVSGVFHTIFTKINNFNLQ